MKKVILSVFVVATLLATGCKKAQEAGKDLKDATVEAADKAGDVVADGANKVVDGAESVVDGAKDLADKAGDAITSAIEGVTIPKFEDPKVGEHLQAYTAYAKEYIAAKGDVVKNGALAKKGVELAAKGKEILASLDAESAAKFKSVMNAIQSKMAPAK